MPSMIKVKCGPNPVWREGVARQLAPDGKDVAAIYPDDVLEVPASRYYLRRVAMGDLKLLDMPVSVTIAVPPPPIPGQNDNDPVPDAPKAQEE